MTYWWNEETDEVTEVGAPRPQTYRLNQNPWEPVVDQASGHTYYWNTITNETTAIGEPCPGPEGRVSHGGAGPFMQVGQPGSLGSSLVRTAAWGFGFAVMFSFVTRLFF